MNPILIKHDVSGEDFSLAGEASVDIKNQLRKMGVPADAIRKAAISIYEAEINLVIHATGGTVEAEVGNNEIKIRVTDNGPGIPDVNLAVSEGFSTATDEIRNLGFGAGMGIPNMIRYTDEFDIKSAPGEGTEINMTVRF
ncbi:MAG: anti-sigma regulatory factor [Ruminococcaceae bacterium]|jgi:serine/threonine-protein kinase RsbT|nr:anti-sigma regulatory factor [Oscillospiraceae bacterium]